MDAEKDKQPETESDRDLKAAQAERARAEARKFEAETRLSVANVERSLLEVEGTKNVVEASRMDLARKKRDEREELARNKYHHVYDFDGSVTDSSVDACMKALTLWARNDPECKIDINFYSPGGSVLAGMKLYDYIQQLRRRKHFITTRCLGMAASMAGILLQAGDRRVMGAESYVLIHEVSTGAIGKIGEIEDEVKFVKMIQERVLDIFALRSKKSKAFFRTHWRRKDWWVQSDQALAIGLVDAVE